MNFNNIHKVIKKRLLTIPLIILSSFIFMYFSIPSNINMVVGENKNLFIGMPITAKIENDKSIPVLSFSEKPIQKNLNIDFGNITLNSLKSGKAKLDISLLGVIPIKSININVLPETKLIPVGKAVGVSVDTNGILVLGTGFVNNNINEQSEPSKGILKTGDLITHINGKKITEKEQLIDIVENSVGNIEIKLIRNGEEIQQTLTPSKSIEDGKQKLGAWVRDCTQGIGTLTYYNPENNSFGALGHGIYDIDTKTLLSIKNGRITETNISGIKKGVKGNPGELIGNTNENKILGEIYKNTECGLYGKILDNNVDFINNKALPIGKKQNIQKGKAYILSNISDNNVKEYEIEIENIDKNSNNPSKGMTIRITDNELLKETGGIIQGMSGSPIIQNNHIIGAVTHVFVNEPTKGYGIFIENML